MKILVLFPNLFDSIGGIQTFSKCFILALDKLASKFSWEITVLVLRDKQELCPIDLKNISYFSFSNSRIKFISSALKHSVKSNIIILGHINFLVLSILFKSLTKAKLILIIYGIDVFRKSSLLLRLSIDKVDKILSISQNTKEQFLKSNDSYKGEIEIFPCTLDPYNINNLLTKTSINIAPKDNKVILTISRLDSKEKYKNIDLVIKAIPAILKEIPNVFYVIIGYGTDLPRLEKLTNDLGINKNVIFKGFVSNDLLPSYYESCDVFVLPSTAEGFGIVFLEAMYFKKPCIGARAGGIPEVIEDRKTGFLCEPNDLKSLSSSIIALLKDENSRTSMGKAGKERLEREFSFERFKERLEKVLCQ